MKLLVTGGAGFIGSNFIRYILKKYRSYEVINLDLLTYAGNLSSLEDVRHDYGSRYRFVKGDIRDVGAVSALLREEGVNVVVNFAAESHVDRSILDPLSFVTTNTVGVNQLLEAVRQVPVDKFVQVSTDEVYGSLGATGLFTEFTPLAPNSPYSASKAGGDLLVRAYHETYGLPVNITRCSNNYGPFQFPEKLIPLMIGNALEDTPLPVYGDGLNVRDWLHVEDHCSAIDLVVHHGVVGEVYNVGGNNERSNIEIVKYILNYLGKSERLISFIEDRKGHDRRYGIDATKIRRELGWTPTYTFDHGIEETIEWYLHNAPWIASVKNGQYREFYQKQYKDRLATLL